MTCTGNARRTGVFDLLGTTVSGWLSDRTNNRLLLFVYYGLRGLAPFYLPDGLAAEGTRLSIFAMFYGLGSVATVPPTVALAGDVSWPGSLSEACCTVTPA